MEYLAILEKIWLILATPSIAVIGYQQYRINKLSDKVDKMITREETHQFMQEKIDSVKEKIVDVADPINKRLDRVDDLLDQIWYKLDRMINP